MWTFLLQNGALWNIGMVVWCIVGFVQQVYSLQWQQPTMHCFLSQMHWPTHTSESTSPSQVKCHTPLTIPQANRLGLCSILSSSGWPLPREHTLCTMSNITHLNRTKLMGFFKWWLQIHFLKVFLTRIVLLTNICCAPEKCIRTCFMVC